MSTTTPGAAVGAMEATLANQQRQATDTFIASTEFSQAPPSQLLALPRELRIMIVDFVLAPPIDDLYIGLPTALPNICSAYEVETRRPYLRELRRFWSHEQKGQLNASGGKMQVHRWSLLLDAGDRSQAQDSALSLSTIAQEKRPKQQRQRYLLTLSDHEQSSWPEFREGGETETETETGRKPKRWRRCMQSLIISRCYVPNSDTAVTAEKDVRTAECILPPHHLRRTRRLSLASAP